MATIKEANDLKQTADFIVRADLIERNFLDKQEERFMNYRERDLTNEILEEIAPIIAKIKGEHLKKASKFLESFQVVSERTIQRNKQKQNG